MSSTSPRRAAGGRITGRVQGVSFRAAMRHQAREHGITGWVRNCPDGAVEFFAQGEPEAMDHLLGWARRGPVSARVEDLQVVAAEPEPALTRFDVLR
jgi:acylphosphatase